MRVLRIITLIFVCGFACAAGAQTRYVSDSLVITVRTGPSTQNAITRNLTSGDRVEVLEELVDEGYARVRLEDGEEGWVLARYLQPELTAAQRLAIANRDLANAQQSSQSAEGEASRLQVELASTRESLQQAQSRVTLLEAEVADIRSASAGALATREQNERLSSRVSSLQAEVDVNEVEIRELQSRNRQSWFIVGASVLLGGIVIGLIAPSLRRKRRSSW